MNELHFTRTEQKTTPSLSIQARYGNSALFFAGEEQLFYLMLELSSPKSEAVEHIPINLVLVLDRSTSMQGLKLDMVKNNAIWLLRHMHEEDSLSIVTFSDQAEILVTDIHDGDRQKIESKISLLQPGGSTEIYNGLESGLSELERNMQPNQINHLILLTDGRTYGDENACLELAKTAAKKGIVINCFGYGNKWNDVFLDKLVSLSGGSTLFVSKPKDLHHFMEDKINHLNRIMINSISMNYGLGVGVTLKGAFRLFPEPGIVAMENPFHLGGISPERPLTVLMEFSIDPSSVQGAKDMLLLNGEFSLGIASGAIASEKVIFDFTCPLSDHPVSDSPDNDVMQAMSDVTLYRMQEMAQEELNQGEPLKASRHLQYLATHLISKGQKELARTALQEADRIMKDKKMTDEGAKQIKYGTRSLMMTSGLRSEDL